MVTLRAGAGLSAALDPRVAAVEASQQAAGGLQGRSADLAVVFASGAHLAAPEAMLEGVHRALAPAALVGCGAGGVLGSGRELESGTAVAVWAATLGDGEARVFRARVTGEPHEAVLEGVPALSPDGALIMLADPYSFPTDAVLEGLAREAPGVPVLGGLSSARDPEGTGVLFLDRTVVEDGAVGVSLDGVEMLPCVSQGAAPLGREVTITAAEGNVIRELAGRPAIETIEQVIGELPLDKRALVAAGLLIGIVIDAGQPEYEQGDFLVRGVLGADPATGSVAVGTTVETGQVVRLHARDARSADEDLRRELRLRTQAIGGGPPAGALMFSCNGRGQAMFGACDHDASMLEDELGGAPAAGFFAAGEIGPVGGRSFLHGFTATVAVFPG
jgi:small ligand-binding sensory domain FIST